MSPTKYLGSQSFMITAWPYLLFKQLDKIYNIYSF